MRFSTVFFATFSLALPAFVVSSPLVNVVKSSGEINGRHIVTFKSGNASIFFAKANNSSLTHQYEIINGFAGIFNEKQIEELRANPDVEGVYEDRTVMATAVQTNATWGLARLSSKTKLKYQNVTATNFTFYYNPDAGRGVDIYIVDSGIYIGHADFGGRAKWGASFVETSDIDDHGHGTHCAGIAASNTYGVAKHANLIAVKVVNKNGTGYTSDIIAGLQYIHKSAWRSGRPSVVSISITYNPSKPLDDAVAKLTRDDIIVVVSAGNNATDASYFSPGRAPSAITVGASDITDHQVTFSNYGKAVDIFAPGVDITSTWIGDKHATSIQSGTSMAAPYISGLVATFLALRKFTVAEMKDHLNTLALKGVLSNVSPNTPNMLAQNGFELEA